MIRRRKLVAPAMAAAALAAGLPQASQAEPAPAPGTPRPPPQWTLCTLEASGGVGSKLAMIVFDPFQVAGDKVPFGDAGLMFHREVGTGTVVPGYAPFNGNGSGSCKYYDTQDEARAERDSWQRTRSYGIVKFVDWRPSAAVIGMGAATGPAKVTGSAGGPGNPADKSGETVKPIDTSLRETGKVWDEQVRKALAEEARRKVETAAKTAQADAKAKADMEAFFKERRRQGRAQ